MVKKKIAEKNLLFDKCPVCHKGKVEVEIAPFLWGLFSRKNILCDNCSSKWKENNGKYQIIGYSTPQKQHKYDGLWISKNNWIKSEKGEKFTQEKFAEGILRGELNLIEWNINLKGGSYYISKGEKEYLVGQGQQYEFKTERSGNNYYKTLEQTSSGLIVLTNSKLSYIGPINSKHIKIEDILAMFIENNKLKIDYGRKEPFIVGISQSDPITEKFINLDIWVKTIELLKNK